MTICLSLSVLSARDVGKEWLENEFLDQEKLEYVKKYLDDIQPETHSVITDKSDSGLGTRGTPSELEVDRDISGQYFLGGCTFVLLTDVPF